MTIGEIIIYPKSIGLIDWLLPFLLLTLVAIVHGIFLLVKDKKLAGILLIVFSLPGAYFALSLIKALERVTMIAAGIFTMLLLLATSTILTIIAIKERQNYRVKKPNLLKPYVTLSAISWILTIIIIVSDILLRPR